MRDKIIEFLEESKVVDKVQDTNINEYDIAANEFINKVTKNNSTLSAIYQVGSVGVCGISDIDYFLFFNNLKLENPHKYYIRYLSPKSKYLFSHDGWFLHEQHAAHIQNWFPFFDMEHVWGEKLTIKSTDDINIKLLILMQYLTTKVPSDFIQYSISDGKLYERTMLAMVNSLTHTINLLKELNITTPEWNDFSANFTDFRKSWVTQERKPYNILNNYIADAIIHSYEIIEHLNRYIKNQFNTGTTNDFEINLGNHKLKFETNWTAENAFDNFIKNQIQTYPINFSFYFDLWQQHDSHIGRYIGKSMSEQIHIDYNETHLKAPFLKHADSIIELDLFCRKKFKITAGGYHVMWVPYTDNFLYKIINKTYKAYCKTACLSKAYLNEHKATII